LSSVEIKSVDAGLVRQRMDEYASAILAGHPEVEEVVVFGSFANGTFAPGSDLDVFLVLSRSDKPVWERLPDYLPGSFPVGLDLFPFTRDEIQRRRPSSLLDVVDLSRWRYRREPAARERSARGSPQG
jgi:predicted nucleotidyltransferase